jgi:hypothetical protein
MLIDSYIAQNEQKLAQLEQKAAQPLSPSERFATDLGHTIYTAMLKFLRAHRADIQGQETAQAAE